MHWMRDVVVPSIVCDCAGEHGLGRAGNVLEEHMAPTQHRGEDELDLLALAVHDRLDVVREALCERRRAPQWPLRTVSGPPRSPSRALRYPSVARSYPGVIAQPGQLRSTQGPGYPTPDVAHVPPSHGGFGRAHGRRLHGWRRHLAGGVRGAGRRDPKPDRRRSRAHDAGADVRRPARPHRPRWRRGASGRRRSRERGCAQ